MVKKCLKYFKQINKGNLPRVRPFFCKLFYIKKDIRLLVENASVDIKHFLKKEDDGYEMQMDE